MSQTPTITPPTCPACGAAMVLRETTKFTYRDGSPRKFWGCSTWPACDQKHGAHPDGRPLGVPTNDPEVKAARILAHAEFDTLWKPELGGWMKRNDAYVVMGRLMEMTRDEAHISMFDKETCERLIQRLREYKAKKLAKLSKRTLTGERR